MFFIFYNMNIRHYLLVKTTVGGRRKRQKRTLVLDAIDIDGRNSDSDNEVDDGFCDSRGLTVGIRRALLIINPLVDTNGKRKNKSSLERGARPPVLTLAESSRVRLLDKLAFYSGLVPGATGTVVGFAYSSDVTFGPPLPGADMNTAIASAEQPQLPMVLVQFDAKYYTGESCHPILPRVVPIYAKTCTIEYNGEKYVREQLPLELANANTVHQAQGTSAKEHVMCPPGAPHADFARALFYVAISRCETLAELYLILYKATPKMFTKHKPKVAEIEAEYERLRQLPKWRDVQLPLDL